MAEHSTPTGRLPDPVSRKTVAPGPNSWAQQRDSTTELITNAKPTNRDKYEHKPMPPPPQSEEDRFGDHYFLQPKAYVRPASPLASSTTPNMPNQKNRAVTDPVAPKPLFADREVSVRQLRKKYSQSKGKDQPSKEPSFEDSQASSKIPMTSEKAAQILGVNPVAGISRNAHPTSTPNESASDFFRSSNGESVERRVTPAQQIQSSPVPRRSTPVPTRRYLKENDLPALPSTEASSGPQQYSDEQEQDEVHASKKAQKQEINKALLHPARIGTNTNIGEVGLVEGSGMHRVESFRGVIEDVPTSSGSNGQVYTESYASSSQPSTGRGQDAERVGPSYSYAPGNYGGVWENDPAVGHALPPFTPMPKGQSSNSNTGSQYNLPLNQSHPGENQGPSHPSNSFSNYQHPLPSANSWASNNSRGNSFAPSSAPPPALLPPGWPQHQNTNSVPSPPQNQEDFQRAGSVSFALTSLELKMHHHIDSTYNSLSRLITDKLDRMTDQTIRRLDNLEDTCNTGLKALKGEVRDLRKHVTNLLGDMEDMKQGRDGTIESVKGIDVILQALERHIEEHACKCQQSAAEQSASEPEYERRHRSEATSRSAYRRTESAHPTVGQGESRQQHRSGASHSSNVTRASATGGRRDRSNSLNVQQPAGRMSDERSRRREYYAGLGAARGPAPDLRDHPAFRDRQHVQQEAYQYGDNQNDTSTVLDELPYETPSLSDGKWYEQAYGKR